MRELFVADLVRNVLGPRNGLRESIDQNPASEYIVGVLAPAKGWPTRDGNPPAPEDQTSSTGPAESEEDAEDTDVVSPYSTGSVLDPSQRPHSIGIAFAVNTPAQSDVSFDLCVTWARYLKDAEGVWRRHPRAFVLSTTAEALRDPLRLGQDGSPVAEAEPAEVAVRSRIMTGTMSPDCASTVVLYLTNELEPPADAFPGIADYHIFQPQIRVLCTGGSVLVPLSPDRTSSTVSPLEAEAEFRYRDQPTLARGLMCSAVWRDVDPQVLAATSPSTLQFPDALRHPPFAWVDGELLAPADRERFASSDVRSEFTPMLPATSPDLDWSRPGSAPVLSAAELAQAWEPATLMRSLGPLVDGYDEWIAQTRQDVASLSDAERQVATSILDRNVELLNRLHRSLAFLASNEDARLAFCFMNEAIARQQRWANPQGTSFCWYPFQIAFILASIPAVAESQSEDRSWCDLLWIPTGGGKTETYLGLMAFTMAFRRRAYGLAGAGTSILSRYTLRLLTIQQFRRTLRLVTACEQLRVEGLTSSSSVGWRPTGYQSGESYLWGSSRFSIGLWVGGGVTPNHLEDGGYPNIIPGALTLLRRQGGPGSAEPAQVLSCPACDATLAVPPDGLPAGTHEFFIVVRTDGRLSGQRLQAYGATIDATEAVPPRNGYAVAKLTFTSTTSLRPQTVDQVVDSLVRSWTGTLASFRGSRPGYFPRRYVKQGGGMKEYEYDIVCPNPDCPLAHPWAEMSPTGSVAEVGATPMGPTALPNIPSNSADWRLAHVLPAFREQGTMYISTRIPVPAYTVDDQVYGRCPSIVVGTVDKIARMPYEPRISGLFGNVSHHHPLFGFYRPDPDHLSPYGTRNNPNYLQVNGFRAPDLIVQDELHLVEGPLGSLAGLYEVAVDAVATFGGSRPKYIASTATARRSEDQTQALFGREVRVFPPGGIKREDSYFVRFPQPDILDDARRGRLYLGICAPGRGPLTPTRDIWASLLQTADEVRHASGAGGLDPFWTLTGYFNAVRELAQAKALYRQDVRERLERLAMLGGTQPRDTDEEHIIEISGRMSSGDLPRALEKMATRLPSSDAVDAIFATSMLGTGVDVSRLGLMVVHGQPKTTSEYIQATGRVGRGGGALVVTFLRSTRPRDLSHYEFFIGYHSRFDLHVEPVTVFPFAPAAMERALGPVAVGLLRIRAGLGGYAWHVPASVSTMANRASRKAAEGVLTPPFLAKARSQPKGRQPAGNAVPDMVTRKLDDWEATAQRVGGSLRYLEYGPARQHVVLGDPAHMYAQGLEVVYPNAPQSLREVDETTTFDVGGARP